MMKQQYEQPKMSILSLGIVDVICASNLSGGTDAGKDDGGIDFGDWAISTSPSLD